MYNKLRSRLLLKNIVWELKYSSQIQTHHQPRKPEPNANFKHSRIVHNSAFKMEYEPITVNLAYMLETQAQDQNPHIIHAFSGQMSP